MFLDNSLIQAAALTNCILLFSESSSLYEEPNETSSRTQRVSDNSNEKRAEVENCTAADSPDKQEDKSAQSSLKTENNARNLYYDAGSTI